MSIEKQRSRRKQWRLDAPLPLAGRVSYPPALRDLQTEEKNKKNMCRDETFIEWTMRPNGKNFFVERKVPFFKEKSNEAACSWGSCKIQKRSRPASSLGFARQSTAKVHVLDKNDIICGCNVYDTCLWISCGYSSHNESLLWHGYANKTLNGGQREPAFFNTTNGMVVLKKTLDQLGCHVIKSDDCEGSDNWVICFASANNPQEAYWSADDIFGDCDIIPFFYSLKCGRESAAWYLPPNHISLGCVRNSDGQVVSYKISSKRVGILNKQHGNAICSEPASFAVSPFDHLTHFNSCQDIIALEAAIWEGIGQNRINRSIEGCRLMQDEWSLILTTDNFLLLKELSIIAACSFNNQTDSKERTQCALTCLYSFCQLCPCEIGMFVLSTFLKLSHPHHNEVSFVNILVPSLSSGLDCVLQNINQVLTVFLSSHFSSPSSTNNEVQEDCDALCKIELIRSQLDFLHKEFMLFFMSLKFASYIDDTFASKGDDYYTPEAKEGLSWANLLRCLLWATELSVKLLDLPHPCSEFSPQISQVAVYEFLHIVGPKLCSVCTPLLAVLSEVCLPKSNSHADGCSSWNVLSPFVLNKLRFDPPQELIARLRGAVTAGWGCCIKMAAGSVQLGDYPEIMHHSNSTPFYDFDFSFFVFVLSGYLEAENKYGAIIVENMPQLPEESFLAIIQISAYGLRSTLDQIATRSSTMPPSYDFRVALTLLDFLSSLVLGRARSWIMADDWKERIIQALEAALEMQEDVGEELDCLVQEECARRDSFREVLFCCSPDEECEAAAEVNNVRALLENKISSCSSKLIRLLSEFYDM